MRIPAISAVPDRIDASGMIGAAVGDPALGAARIRFISTIPQATSFRFRSELE
jgi:hypothetical protein